MEQRTAPTPTTTAREGVPLIVQIPEGGGWTPANRQVSGDRGDLEGARFAWSRRDRYMRTIIIDRW